MADSTSPLTPSERRQLLLAFDREPEDLPNRVTHLIYSTGAHPSVVAEPKAHKFRVQEGTAVWLRPKTRRQVAVPVDPAIAPGLPALLEELEAQLLSRVRISQLVAAFGVRAGIIGLCPRALRHDFASRAEAAHGVSYAKTLTGTSTEVLLRYSARRQAEEVAKDPRGLWG